MKIGNGTLVARKIENGWHLATGLSSAITGHLTEMRKSKLEIQAEEVSASKDLYAIKFSAKKLGLLGFYLLKSEISETFLGNLTESGAFP